MQQWLKSFVLRDQIYQIRNYPRDHVRLLIPCMPAELDLANKNVQRIDHLFAVTWAKMSGKGTFLLFNPRTRGRNREKPEFQKIVIGDFWISHRTA